jgi:hypothetical protein
LEEAVVCMTSDKGKHNQGENREKKVEKDPQVPAPDAAALRRFRIKRSVRLVTCHRQGYSISSFLFAPGSKRIFNIIGRRNLKPAERHRSSLRLPRSSRGAPATN